MQYCSKVTILSKGIHILVKSNGLLKQVITLNSGFKVKNVENLRKIGILAKHK